MFISTRRFEDYKPSIDLIVSPLEIIESGIVDLLSTKDEDTDCGFSQFIRDIEHCTEDTLILIYRQYPYPSSVERALNSVRFKNNPILRLFQYKDEVFDSDINYTRICACSFSNKEDLPYFFKKVFTDEEIQQYKTTPAELAILKVYLGV